jgi:hypothetical protein
MTPEHYLKHARGNTAYAGFRILVALLQWGTLGLVLAASVATFSLSLWQVVAVAAATVARVVCVVLMDMADASLLRMALDNRGEE